MHEWYKTFIMLAECKSFTETARRLFCSQPTVSQHIQQLEKSYGCSLIVRNKRQIELTMQGELLLQHAFMIEKQEQELRLALAQIEKTKKTSIYLSSYIVSHYFEELFAGETVFSADSPYELNSFDYAEIKQCLVNEKAKFAVMPIYAVDQSLMEQFDIEPLVEEELVLVMAKEHPLAKRQVLYARDLKDYPVYLPQSEYYAQSVREALLEKEITPNYVQMPNFIIIKQAIQRSIGVAFLPKQVIKAESPVLINKPIKGLSITRHNGLVFNKKLALSANEQVLCQHIRNTFKTPAL